MVSVPAVWLNCEPVSNASESVVKVPPVKFIVPAEPIRVCPLTVVVPLSMFTTLLGVGSDAEEGSGLFSTFLPPPPVNTLPTASEFVLQVVFAPSTLMTPLPALCRPRSTVLL